MWTLETDRLVIRELTNDDFDALFSIYQEEAVRAYVPHIRQDREIEAAKLQAYITMVYGFYGFGLWGLFLKESGTLIGQAGIESQSIEGNGEIMLSYLLGGHFQGQGYAREACDKILNYAVNELEFERIVAVISPENSRSIHLAEKLGMTFSHTVIHEGTDCSLYVFRPHRHC